MQVALGIAILLALFGALVLIHNGSVNLLRFGALSLLRAADWCEARRFAAAASLHERRLEVQAGSQQRYNRALHTTAAAPNPMGALKIMVRLIETLPAEMLEQAMGIDDGLPPGAPNGSLLTHAASKKPLPHAPGRSRSSL
ncbi:MAG: hypothetical protein KIT09_10635 [Bryobacteraceae bacterium]|nr:hypothetical protein [Bryobacteraceae bacterium]